MFRKIFIYHMIIFAAVVFSSENLLAEEKNSHISKALQVVDLSFNKQALYQQFMYFGILPVKERYENNPKTKNYSEIIIGTFAETMHDYFNDPETQSSLKAIYASIYAEEFTEEELREMITFYESKTGQKLIEKTPSILEKGQKKEIDLSNGFSSSKYAKLLVEKIEKLQRDGFLPKNF